MACLYCPILSITLCYESHNASGASSLPSGDGTTSQAAAATFPFAIVVIPAHKPQNLQLHAPLAFIELSGLHILMQL